MAVTSVNRVKSIVVPLSSASGNQIVTIYENSGLTIGDELIPNHKIVSVNCFIKNLKAFAEINSLPEINLPNFSLEDSETDKLYKVMGIEWGSARKQLTLYISAGSGWSKVGSLSLLNPSGYPYRVYNLIDLFTDALAIELGDNSRIGIQVEDVGYGLLAINDTVTIHGSYVEEIFVESPNPQPIINVNVSGGGAVSTPTTSRLLDNNAVLDNNFYFTN